MLAASRHSDLYQSLAQEVHVWYLPLPERLPLPCEQLLSSDERSRWRRYRHPAHRHRFLLGKALQRMALSAYLPIAPAAWQFVQQPRGRPEVDHPQAGRRLRFSLSHTFGLCALAVTLDRNLGMDVEHAGFSPTANLVDFALSPAERTARSEQLAKNPSDPFFDFWTLKEAYLKALGIGLSIPPSALSFTLLDDGGAKLTNSSKASETGAWQFTRLRPTQNHQLAVAMDCQRGPLFVVLRDAMNRWRSVFPDTA